ncbi:POU domain class 2-associating factor 2 [Microcaecilia unicolor]|uniref:Uncharacterized protein C11orf53 homolog n=1 Tax=Microcaecilia unicolor TaxID=1415580 RepID=A0A6P7ZI29_9AMPH|nr:uncharacterized protein C11orf53 homolog [Microcaecilia unicolor]
MCLVPTDFNKRIYQGVRVKHTVKDLLAEKRSRQTTGSRFNGSASPVQTPFVQMSGSPPMLSGYYGMRRSFLSDSDFQNTKQYSSDVYASALSAKPLSCDTSSAQGYPPMLDPYFTEPFGDYRATPLATPSSGSLFSASTLPPLLPHFSGDSTHFLLRDSWEQSGPDGINQSEAICPDALQTAPSSMANCLVHHEPSSTPQYRSSTRCSVVPGTPSYSLHAFDDTHYTSSFPTTSAYSFPSFMTVANELPSKMAHLPSDETSEASALQDSSSWAKEDANVIWGSYEFRRNY